MKEIIIMLVVAIILLLVFFPLFRYASLQDVEIRNWIIFCEQYASTPLKDIPGDCVSHFMPNGL